MIAHSISPASMAIQITRTAEIGAARCYFLAFAREKWRCRELMWCLPGFIAVDRAP